MFEYKYFLVKFSSFSIEKKMFLEKSILLDYRTLKFREYMRALNILCDKTERNISFYTCRVTHTHSQIQPTSKHRAWRRS